MKLSVAAAIEAGIKARRSLLGGLSHQQRVALLEELFTDFFGDLHTTLQKWAALTGQSAQVDTGYIAQFVASIVLQEPGQGFRGKGDDLADGSEVKSAANISGVDRPRWNHNLGTLAQDAQRRAGGKPTSGEEYLSVPYFFYLLVDRSASDTSVPRSIRIRGWLIDAQNDVAWRDLLQRFLDDRGKAQYNLQLHPPVGWDDHVVVNTLGNLDFADVAIFEARVRLGADGATVKWPQPLPEAVLPVVGRTRAVSYGGRKDRPSRLTDATDLVADIAVVPDLFPGILSAGEEATLERSALDEAESQSPEVPE